MTFRRLRMHRHTAPRTTSRLYPPRRRQESAFEWLVADPVFERVVAAEA